MKVVQSWTIRKFQNFGSHQKVMDDLLQHRQYRKFEPLNLSKNIRLVRKPRSLNLTEQNPLCWDRPNITNHYHAFGYHNGNNQGRFISSRETSSYLLPVGFGTRYWNGKEGGNDFQESSTYEANLVTSEAVFGDTHQIVQPSSCRVLPCIKV